VEDTSPAARRRYYELLAQKSPVERLAMAVRLSSMVRMLAEEAVRAGSPDLSERAMKKGLADRLYGRAVAERLFPGE
jgi:hypothetical protein